MSRLKQPTRIYESSLELLFAVMPAFGILYLINFQDSTLKIVAHSFHIYATGLSVLLSGFIAYVTYHCYKSTGEVLLRYLALSLGGFTLCYTPHSILTLMAEHDMRLFLIYGPVSRVVMNGLLFIGLLKYVRMHRSDVYTKSAQYWLKWIGGLLLLDCLIAILVKTDAIPFQFLRIALESVSLSFAILGILLIVLKIDVRSFVMKLFMLALLYLAQGSIAFLMTTPWSHLWWYSHAITAGGFFVLSYVVVRAYDAAGSLSSVYSIDELMASLRQSQLNLSLANQNLADSNQQLSEANRKMEQLAMFDELTGVINRRGFFSEASKAISRLQRINGSCVALMLDIDHFKNINDNYGHGTGDVVLKAFAVTVQKSLRESDYFGRLGGEEFAVLLPDTSIVVGCEIAERVRASIEALMIPVQADNLTITVSIGVAESVDLNGAALHTLLSVADEHLYQAKQAGRNRVV